MTPRQVGNYRLDSLLGSGGMGDVYRAYDTHRDRYVALKLLQEAFSGDPEYLQRFQRESNVAARLRDPHVIPIHDFGEIDGQLFIDMRLVDGADIAALLKHNGRIAPERAVYLVGQVAEALDAAHADHLVHRDIKPSNILVTLSDFVYVVDFGIARLTGSQQTPLTITGITIGTWAYMAPERFEGRVVDGRADVYSLACVLHECLTGVPPFGDKDLPALLYAQLYSDPPPASSLVAGVPPALDAVIARGMAKDPNDRFPTAGMLAAAARVALLAEPPVPPVAELHVPARTEIPAPAWPAATAVDAWQGVPDPQGPEPEPAGDGHARGVVDSPTQTVLAYSVDDRGGTESMPPGTRLDQDGGGLPPDVATGGPARKPARRRLGLLILAVAVVVAIPVAIVLAVTARPNAGGASATTSAGGATSAAAAGPTTSVSSAAASLALPTVAGKNLLVGQTPSYVQVAPNGKFAYIANPGARAISVLNTATDKVSKTIPIPQGPPQFVSFSPDSKTAYVSVYGGKSTPGIAFIDTATGTVLSTVVPVDNYEPGPSTTGPDGQFLYVPNHNMTEGRPNDNVIDVIDLASKKLTDIPVAANPHWVVYDKENGRIYASDHMSAQVTVLNPSNNGVITTINVGDTPHGETLSPDGSRLAVTSYSGDEVFLINTAINQLIKPIPVGREPLEAAYSPDGRYLFTVNNLSNTVTVIDTADNGVIGTLRTGKAPTSISVLPNGRQAYVTDEGDGTIEILNLPK